MSVDEGLIGPTGATGPEGRPGVDFSVATLERLATLLESTEGIRESIRVENAKRDKRIRLSRILIVLVLAVAVFSNYVGYSARQELHESNARTASARIASCKQYNLQQAAQIAAEKSEERQRQSESNVAVDRLLKLLHLSTSDLATLRAQHLKRYDATVDSAHQLRDCSPAGITRYLSEAKK